MPPLTRSQRTLDKKPSEQELFNEILQRLSLATEFTEIVYSNIQPELGGLIYHSLLKHEIVERQVYNDGLSYNSVSKVLRVTTIPTELHNAHQRWATSTAVGWGVTGLFNPQEAKLLCSEVGTTFEGFTGIYAGSAKEPDFFLARRLEKFPSIVIESGCGERVAGRAEIWRRTATGISSNTITIFPAPAPGLPDTVDITKRQLFGQAVLPGQNPNTILQLDFQDLRDIATEVLMKRMNMVPA
ncbi:hypothetical protein PISL3812_01640 [Talaromyces islandicus]|uniref:Uncharacterized protein n=1 Tax=Talaromyces islandicus TaxID=28573 RepID=A0A0U1LNA9_TALIS|nr:hypothetical protein PISL3812_01640 [Talaromyces islandicus]